MKKLFIVILACFSLCTIQLNAQQIFFENFDALTPPNLPTKFKSVDQDGDKYGWLTDDSKNIDPNFTFGNVIVSESWVPDGTTAGKSLKPDNLLIIGPIDLSGVTSDVRLRWNAFSLGFGGEFYEETYSVYVSTSETPGTPVFEDTLAAGYTLFKENIDISNMVGQETVYIMFRHHNCTDKMALVLDDIRIEYSHDIDMELSLLTIPSIHGPGNVNITGVVTNLGLNPISSFDIRWDDGSGFKSQTFQINLDPDESYTFLHGTPLTLAASQSSTITVEVVADKDELAENNSITTTTQSGAFTPSKKIVYEDLTICSPTFGGFCPRGIVELDKLMLSDDMAGVEIISIHGNTGADATAQDPMRYLSYADSCFDNKNLNAVVWPNVLVDRKVASSYLSDFSSFYSDLIEDFGYADMEVKPVYDPITRKLEVSCDVKFAADAKNFNLALVITEDSVHDATDDNYRQRNFYSPDAVGGQAGRDMKSSTLDFSNLPEMVPASLMYYRNVARKIIPSYSGSFSSLPNDLFTDSTYSYSFPSYTVPANFKDTRLRAIVMLIDASNGQVMNSKGEDVEGGIASIRKAVLNDPAPFNVYPNPANDYAYVQFNFESNSKAEINITDLSGKVIHTQMVENPQLNKMVKIDKINFPTGVYIISVRNENLVSHSRIVFE